MNASFAKMASNSILILRLVSLSVLKDFILKETNAINVLINASIVTKTNATNVSLINISLMGDALINVPMVILRSFVLDNLQFVKPVKPLTAINATAV